MADGNSGYAGPEECNRLGEPGEFSRLLISRKQLDRTRYRARIGAGFSCVALGFLIQATQRLGYGLRIGAEDVNKKLGGGGKVIQVIAIRQSQIPEPIEHPECIRGVEFANRIGKGCECFGIPQCLCGQNRGWVPTGRRAGNAVGHDGKRRVAAAHGPPLCRWTRQRPMPSRAHPLRCERRRHAAIPLPSDRIPGDAWAAMRQADRPWPISRRTRGTSTESVNERGSTALETSADPVGDGHDQAPAGRRCRSPGR